MIVFAGFVFRILILTAAPPSCVDCVTRPGASRFGRLLAAVYGVFGVVSIGKVRVASVDEVGVSSSEEVVEMTEDVANCKPPD